MLRTAVKPYFYAITYVLSVLAFFLATDPEIWQDYLRVLALAMGVLIFLWIIQAAVIYQRRYRSLPAGKKNRMVPVIHVWGMGIAYGIAVAPSSERVIEYFGEPVQWDGLPILIASYAFASVWLWPLVRHERSMEHRERRAGVAA